MDTIFISTGVYNFSKYPVDQRVYHELNKFPTINHKFVVVYLIVLDAIYTPDSPSN